MIKPLDTSLFHHPLASFMNLEPTLIDLALRRAIWPIWRVSGQNRSSGRAPALSGRAPSEWSRPLGKCTVEVALSGRAPPNWSRT